ncbi:MAG: bifunctional demethylmenaquinone methyltransferase/2-methoxy-6-polyprenyl-1,4-benzoquinol methylase UbiE [Pseudomonadota bacterium]|nr:bifunctional demethylmenaquinone methyltransferase/2-methoxy-6-polyprenyl-1,4-benzoquinol methylase UbiE [Pseudomonadota bacterium]
MKRDEDHTDFGYQEIPAREKFRRVEKVFSSVAPSYDLMNDLMSFGIHRFWKKYAVELLDIEEGQVILDLASGTGDISKLIGEKLGENDVLLSCDANFRMLSTGRDKLTDRGLVNGLTYVGVEAESLPFPDASVNRIIVSFGLRNFSDKKKALDEMYRVLKMGGRLVLLEFSTVRNQFLSRFYNFYSFKVLPRLGEAVAKDRESYQYLVESIRRHPDQESLKTMMEARGFENVSYFNFLSGIVAIHLAQKT